MSEKIVERILARAEALVDRHWPSPLASAGAAIGAAVALYAAVGWVPPLRGTAADWALPLLGAVGVLAAAGVSAWRRRIPAGYVGVLVALAPETDAQAAKLRHDFLLTLRRLLNQRRGSTRFRLVEVSRLTSRSICDDSTQALPLLQRRGGHILVFGSVHTVAGQGTHADQLLVLGGSIRHAPISTNIHGELTSDFCDLITRRFRIRGDDAFLQFEATSAWLDVAVRHVVGFAAALSRDYAQAESLLLEVAARLPGVVQAYPRDPAVRRVAKRFPSRLAMLYRWWLNDLSSEYLRTRDLALVQEMDEVADRLLELVPDDYGAHLGKAMCEFVLRGDVAAARRYVFACRKAPDSRWRYSAAFLDAYQGKLGRAREEYMRAFAGLRRPRRGTEAGKGGSAGATADGGDTLPVECEEFIQLVLEREPGKAQLHFCTALINKFAKLDSVAASRDLGAFLQGTTPEQFPQERKLATEWLREIEGPAEHAA